MAAPAPSPDPPDSAAVPAAGRRLSPTSLSWSVGLFISFLGAFILVAPHQFASPVYSLFLPHLALWGVVFLIGGMALVTAAAVRPRGSLLAAAHLGVAAVLAMVAVGMTLSGLIPAGLSYLALAVGTAWAARLPPHDPHRRRLEGDLLSAVVGLGAAAGGLALMLLPLELLEPVPSAGPLALRVLGSVLLPAGLLLTRVQLRPTGPALRWAAHLAAGGALLASAAVRSWPSRAWSGVVLNVLLGLAVGAMPWLRRRFSRFDPATLASRMALSLAGATSLALIASVALVTHQEELLAEREVEEAQSTQARNIAGTIADFVELNAARTVALATLAARVPMTVGAQREFLDRGRESYPEIASLATLDAAGGLVARTPGPPLSDALLADLARRIGEREGREVELRFVRPAGRSSLLLAASVPDPAGGVGGVVVTLHDSAALAARIDRERSRVIVSDGSGRMIAAQGVSGLEAPLGGGPLVAASAEVPGLGWVVSVERRRATALAGVRRGRDVAFLLLLAIAGLAIAVGVVAAGRITRPLGRLAVAVDGLAAGNPSVPLPTAGITEVDLLSRAYGEMRDRLAERTRESEQLAAELRTRAEALAEADRRKDEFLAMLAHELRNPLGAISNASHLIAQVAPGDGEIDRSAEVIQRQTRHLTRLVDDLLDVSRITRGKVELRREPVDLVEVVRHALDTLRPLVEDRDLTLGIELPDEVLPLRADLTRLEQVVGNLVRNAVKFTEPGGRIEVALVRRGDRGELAVADTGVGIEPELLPRVFDLFAQGAQTLDRAGAGLGIGLTLVRSLVELHGGRVRAESAGPGTGSRFVLELPLSQALRGELAAARRGAAAASAAVPGIEVMVVEDNRDAAAMLALLLESYGHRVRVVHDGEAALAAVGERPPRVVLLDIGLPGMDGYELARRLRRGRGGADLVLVALTGYGREDDRRRAHQAGCDHHLVKPVEPALLQEILAACTGGPQREPSMAN